MANKEHLKILMKGVEVWNKWRLEYPDVKPCLVDAILRSADLAEANLSQSDFRGADLRRANLYKTTLRDADCRGADFIEAKLSKSNLIHANFSGADLSAADLRFTNCSYADIRGANLSGADLSGSRLNSADIKSADLSGAKLIRTLLISADLIDANLDNVIAHGANFDSANLTETKFRGANLKGADFNRAYLRGTDLSGAELIEANLAGTHFIGTILTGATLAKATMIRTVFSGTDLRNVGGLSDVRHRGPSEIGIDTISLAEGNIPEVFLRGYGLKDWEIEATKLYRSDLSMNEIIEYVYKVFDLRSNPYVQFYSCFISYSSADEEFAKTLYNDLQESGVRCWFAAKDMKIGDRIRYQLDHSIRLYDKVLLVLSGTSVASQWVEQEVETALAKERDEKCDVLFPVRLDDAVMNLHNGWPALIRNTRHIGDFSRWEQSYTYRESLARLLNDLRVRKYVM